MIGSDIVTEIAGVLGNRTGIETRILRGITLAKSVLEKQDFLPWFLVTTIADTVTITSDERVAVPGDFIRELEEVGDLWIIDSDGNRTALKKRDYDVLRNEYADVDPGVPKYYALTGNYFRLFPIPNAVLEVQMLYYANDAAEANDSSESLWGANAPEILISYGGFYTARGLRAEKAMKIFSSTMEKELTDLQIADEARKQANLPMWLGMYDSTNEAI